MTLTLTQILTIEPEIARTLESVRHARRRGASWARVYRDGKQIIGRLAGYSAQNPELRSSAVYETCVRALADALECRARPAYYVRSGLRGRR